VNIQNSVSSTVVRSVNIRCFRTVTITHGTVGISVSVDVVRSND
jgi:hypothetical protein